MKRNIRRWFLRLTVLGLCLSLSCPLLAAPAEAALKTRTLSLSQAQSMAIRNSSDITKKNNEIILKKMKYVEAVQGIKAKVKNLKSFRWTPLLSFKFPQQLALTEDYDLNIKPMTIQTEIDTLTHAKNDLRFSAIQEVNQRYYEVYILQETVAFTEERLADARQQLERNKAKLATGDATQTDVDRAQSSVDTLTTDLSTQKRELEKAKEKLSESVGTDVSVGYKFTNAFKYAAIPREALDSLVQYTLDHDQVYYEAKMATATAKLNMEAYEGFMRSEYGQKKMNYIQPFINQAKKGLDVDYAAFQLKYKEMLKALDKPWAGKIRILFFSFTMEWFKGEIDGTRYIEDEMYAVYTACMEYGNAKKEQDVMEKELRTRVKDTYESLVTNWNSYLSLAAAADKAEETLERTRTLNQVGKATYSEVADEQTAYQDAQMDMLDSLKAYNDLINEFDRLTCGAVTKYLQSTGMGLETGEGGDAYAILDPIEDPYYYMYTSVADLTFYIGVSIPEGFEPAVDSYEVWYDGMQIGKKTNVGEEIRHLTLDYKDTNKLLIRLYNGDSFVDECEINATVPRERLDVKLAKAPETTRTFGTYEVSTTMSGGVSVSELKLSVDATEGAGSYTLHYGDKQIYTTDAIPIKDPFSYLTLMMSDLENVTGTLYDKNDEKLLTFRFDTEALELVTDVISE